MDCCLSCTKPRFPPGSLRRPISSWRRPVIVAASTGGAIKCEFGGLNAPLELKTPAGRLLSSVLLDDRDNFQVAAGKELERLAAERDEAAARLQLSLGSDEACLHRRIADFRNNECQDAVEDVMYMLIFHKFSEMRVNLVPRLSKCLYNGRLEILPSKDWELESIHNVDVLQMVREHVSAMVGCRANASVTESWVTTEIRRLRLCKIYVATILYGYFLKSASLRFQLERGLESSNSRLSIGVRGQLPVSEMFSTGSKYVACGHLGRRVDQITYGPGKKRENLRFYMMGFDQETIQMCAKPKSKEAVSLVERHSCALFGDDETGLLEIDDVITTSFASLKRFMLEAVAFGSFLWDVENSVNTVYMLDEN